MSRNERKKAQLELKFQKKEELAKSKIKLANNIKEIRNQIKIAAQQEIALKAQVRKDKIKEKQEYQESIVKDRADFYRQRALITENKKYLIAKKRELKEAINLAKTHNRQLLLQEKENHRQALLVAKQQKREEILKHKQKVEELRSQQQEKLVEANKKIIDKENEVQIFKMKQEELISRKKRELEQKKAELVAKRLEDKLNAKKRRQERLLEAKMTKEELKALEISEKSKLNHLKISLQSEQVSADQDNQESLEAETKKAEIAVMETSNVTKNSNKKISQLHHEFNEDAINEEKQKIWEQETSINMEENEWDESSEERQQFVKGVIIQSMGKDAWKIYDKSNKKDTKLKLDKVKLQPSDIELIKEFRKAKDDQVITDIREFVKYIAYLTNRNDKHSSITNELVAVIVNVLQGKTLQFMEGYFFLEKHGSYRLIRYSDKLSTVASKVVSLPDETFYNMLQEVILRKLKKGLVIKVNENIALKYQDKQVVVMHDLGFIR